MMETLLPLSALQHLAFCERQCALIHVEQVWADNRLTAEGHILHARVDELSSSRQADVVVARGLLLRSSQLGLSGKADVVEFHCDDAGVAVPGLAGLWRPFPVEYKRGRRKRGDCDEIQLCAQAMCLEEMLSTSVLAGALYYGQHRRRTDLQFGDGLRARVRQAATRLHEMIQKRELPRAVREKKCESCSLLAICMPPPARLAPASRYLQSLVDA